MEDYETLENARAVVNEILRERLARYGFREAEVTLGYDHDGDEALFIDAHYDLKNEPLPPRIFYGLTGVIRNALQEQGEPRFPHLRNHFDERQQVAK